MTGTVLFVSSGGGHLDELVRLAPRIVPAGAPQEWVVPDTAQSRELLAGRVVHAVAPVDPRDAAGAGRALAQALVLIRERRPVRMITTGAAVAVPYALAARARNVGVHYVESCARTVGPSRTGRLVERIPGVRCYTQMLGWAGGRWQWRGSVLDGFRAADQVVALPPGGLRRVLVLFGTQRRYPYDRAARRLATLLPHVLARDADVLWQTGCTDPAAVPVRWQPVRLLPPAELAAAAAAADLVIAHAGVGSALLALEAGHCPVLLPRRRRHGEHADDHQTQLAGELAARGMAVARDPNLLSVGDLIGAAAVRVSPPDRQDPLVLLEDWPGTPRRAYQLRRVQLPDRGPRPAT
jgi:UDP-N-acetylglucosamine--N-acetylmuramyl-(pentapeptide) pyrophosphoryl-undecaprenol N-acetylglucosamine transferase